MIELGSHTLMCTDTHICVDICILPSCTINTLHPDPFMFLVHMSVASKTVHFTHPSRTALYFVSVRQTKKVGSERSSDLLKVTQQAMVNLPPPIHCLCLDPSPGTQGSLTTPGSRGLTVPSVTSSGGVAVWSAEAKVQSESSLNLKITILWTNEKIDSKSPQVSYFESMYELGS